MLLLTSTSDKVQVVTGASADVRVHADFLDNLAGAITPGRTNTASIATATTTDVVASPGATTQRNVRGLTARNVHASTSCDVTVQHTDGTNVSTLIKVTLLAGESLVFDALGKWHHYDSNAAEYGAPPGGAAWATRTEMEAGTATDRVVTPAMQHYHPGHPKAWVKCGVTGNILASYNISSVTDTGAGIATPQIANDFSTANWACVTTVERSSTSLTVTNLKFVNIRSGTQTAGAVGLEVYDGTATTAVQEDPTAYSMAGFGTLA